MLFISRLTLGRERGKADSSNYLFEIPSLLRPKRVDITRDVTIPALDPNPDPDFSSFWTSDDSNSGSESLL